MNDITAELISGTLYEYAKKVEHTLLYTVDPRVHADTYASIEHPDNYAEPEFTGKYLDLCTKIYRTTGNPDALHNANIVADSIIENQREDGYLGCLRRGLEYKNFSVWNQAFTILGLTSYYHATGRKAALNAAVKCAEFVMEHFIGGADILDAPNNGTQHISILAPLCGIYSITKSEKHLGYISFIVESIKSSDLNFFEFDSIMELRSKKGIENFVILMGLLKYADITGDTATVASVEKYWQQVADTQIRNTGCGTIFEVFTEGGSGCMLLDAQSRPNETCVAVGWCELSLSLFYHTQDKKYLDAIDKTLYNHILASIAEDGSDFAYYQPNFGKKVRAMNGYYKCCRYRGFTLFTYMSDILCFEDEYTVIPMLYTSFSYNSDAVKLEMRTEYPFDTIIALNVTTKKQKTLKLRIPKNTEAKTLTVNSQPHSIKSDNGYIIIQLTAGTSAEIVLTLENIVSVELGNIAGKEYAALTYGCILLAAKEGSVLNLDTLPLIRSAPRDGALLGFSACDVELCDYASADDYTVWIPLK
ncbi:MAG: glycoside hydrolase family 127 protein [Clostridia bacterium]|nr:glycoside hydrolase family 127 protein [Clostridia bacterium]